MTPVFQSLKQQPTLWRSALVLAVVWTLFMASLPMPATAQLPEDKDLDHVTLHLKWKHAFQFAGYYAAREQGYYRGEGLDVTINEAAAEFQAINTVLDGDAQYGVWSADVLNDRIGGSPFVILAVIFQHSPYVVLSRKDSGIRVPSDLIGRTVMIEAKQGSAQFKAMLLNEGLSPADVNIVPHSWSVDDLLDRKVDASMDYITDEPNQMSMHGVEPAIMQPIDYGIDFYGDCLFTTEMEIEQNPERVEGFRRASLKGWEYAMNHVDELVELILLMPGVQERGLTNEHLHYEADQMQTLIQPTLIEIGHINPGRWKHIADTYVRLEMLDPNYSLDGFLYDPNPSEDKRWMFAFLGILAGVVLVAGMAWAWNRQLRGAVVRRTHELLESETRFEQLGNATWEAIVIHDKGIVLEANDQYFEMFGYEREELLGKEGISRTTTHESTEVIIQQVATGNLGPYKATGKRKDGEEFPMELRIRMMNYHGRQVRVAAIRDMTDQEKAKAALLQEKNFAEVVINSLPGIFYLYDDHMRLVRWNRTLEEISGYSAEELDHKPALDFFAEKDRAKATKTFQRVFAGEVVGAEFDLLAKNDKEVPIYLTGAVTSLGGKQHLVGVGLDITSRKQAEEDRERLSTAIEQAAETIVITDVEGIIQYANPAFERITGYTPRETIGGNPRILKSGKHDAAFYKEMWDTLTRGETWSGRIINKRKDGTLFTEEAVISPVRDDSGKTVNYVAAKRDITEEIKLEEQLRQAQKMEAVGQLAGGVAHDFNNLLQVINGCSEFALESLDKEHGAHGHVEEIAKAGERAATLVGQLLAFSRRQVLDIKDVQLNEVIADLMKMIQRVIGEHIILETIVGHDLGIVHADPGQLEQILMNLCVNARDAMLDGGTITIETENVLVGQEYVETHPGFQPGRYVLLSVTDTGCGMDNEMVANVFEPFYTTKGLGEGTGLGLSTVYGLVKQHNGMIHVYSEVGKGTTFKIYLPLAEISVGSVGSKIKGSAPGGTETILLAEDDEMILKLAQTVLESAGYTVLTATNGEEALQVYNEHSDAVDLALIDVIMPKLGGKAVLQGIREERPDLRFLFASGYSMNAVHTNFILNEGLQLIQKPYRRDDLLRKVRGILDG